MHSARPKGQRRIVIIAQKLKCGRILRSGGHLKKGKQSLVEHNMARYDDAIGVEIEASIPFVIRRVAKENT
jgi:hypothetical protein